MKKILAILSIITFTTCSLGLFYFEDLEFEFSRIYIPFIILIIFSLLLFIILLVQIREQGTELFSKILGISILSFIVLIIVFPFGLAIYKKQTGYQTKKDIQIKGYEKMIEKLYSNYDNKILTETKERFIENIDSNTKFDCVISFDSIDADVDLLPNMTEQDSFNFESEYWDKNDFKNFYNNLKANCLNGDQDSVDYHLLDKVLFNGSDKISVEINEIFREDTIQDLTFVIYGNNSYAIITYKEKMNKNESTTQK